MRKNAGFTLIEVLIATAILVTAILSTLSLLTHSLSLAQGDRELAVVQYEAEREMERICALDYLTIRNGDATVGIPAYTNNGALRQTSIANITNNLDRSGTVYAQELAVDGLIRIKVVVCYLQKNRPIGEDANFNGVLDGGEDANGNGELDSPCQIETVVANKI